MPDSMPSFRFRHPSIAAKARWLAAALAAVLAIALRAFLQPALGDELPFIIAAPVALFCALMWGAGPGALATLICLVGTLLPSMPPDVLNREGGVRAVGFALVLGGACVLVARVNALRRRHVRLGTAADMPLVRWLNAALFGAVLLPATAFVLVGWWTYEQALQASHDTVVRRADLVYQHARRTFDVAEKLTLEAALLTTGNDDVIRRHESDVRQRLSDMLLGVPSVVNLNVWDAMAVPVVRSDRAIDPTVTVIDRSYFTRQAVEDRGFDLSEVLKGRQTGRELFNLTHRRPAADGRFNGIVAVSLNPEYFRDYYRAILAQNTDVESISLVRTDGDLLARWPVPATGTTHVAADSPSLEAIRSGESSGVVYGRVGRSGEPRVAAFRRVEEMPVYVVVSFSQAALMSGWVRTMGIVGAMALPITLLLIAVTAIARRRVQLEQQAQLDLHEQTRLRAASEKSVLEAHRRETLSTLTAGVAHDFNNLLAILTNSLHIQNVRHPEHASEPQNAAMRRAVQSGTRLTRQLLSLTRRQTLRPEVIDLRTWLPEIEELLRTTLGRSIALSVDVASNLPPVLVDAAELELALVNLAVNAKHAQPHGGVFVVNADGMVEGGKKLVTLSARDEGHGIPSDILGRVSEPFFTTKERGSGSGLGLNQVRGVAEAAGGELRIESAVGQGTTVRLILPAADVGPDGAAGSDETQGADRAGGSGGSDRSGESDAVTGAVEPKLVSSTAVGRKFHGHVLVAEDNDDVAAATIALIASLGLKVTRAVNADDALRVLRTPQLGDDIGFLLTDAVMPGAMGGVELAMTVRGERPRLPVTVITGYAENVQSALDATLDVVHKPLALEDLMTRLQGAFGAA